MTVSQSRRFSNPTQANPRILEIIEQYAPRPYKVNRYSVRSRYSMQCPCPGHAGDTRNPDNSGSFSIDDTDQLFICFGCGAKGNAWQLEELLSGHTTKPYSTPKQPIAVNPATKTQRPYRKLQGATLETLAKAKGLDAGWLSRSLGWQDSNWYGTPAVLIPYCNSKGAPLAPRYRVGITGEDRFRWAKGANPTLYGLLNWAKVVEQSTCILVEGETNTASLLCMGYMALGIPGAANYKEAWTAGLKGLSFLYLCQDPDEAGEKLREKIKSQLSHLRTVKMPDGVKDVNELLQKYPGCQEFQAQMEKLLDDADTRFNDEPPMPEPTAPQSKSGVYCNRTDYPVSPDIKSTMERQKNMAVEYYRRSGHTDDANHLADCGTKYQWKECDNSHDHLIQPAVCHDPNCLPCSIDKAVQFFKSKDSDIKDLMSKDATIFKVPITFELDPTQKDRVSEIRKIHRDITKSIRRFGDQQGESLELARDHIRSMPTRIEGDTYTVTLVFVGKHEKEAIATLSAHFSRDMRQPVTATEQVCHGIHDAISQAAQAIAVRCQWDTADNFSCWQQGTKHVHQIQGKGKYHMASKAGASKKARAPSGGSCPICGNCTPKLVKYLPVATTKVKRVKSEITGRYYLVVDDDTG